MTDNARLVKVADLAKQDVTGLMADIRSREADGTLRYNVYTPLECADNSAGVPLTKVYWHKEAGKRWLRWEWDGKGKALPLACGYSGMREDLDVVEQTYILVWPK